MIPKGYRLGSRKELDARLRPFPLTKPDGYNTRTGRPERSGIFCCRIFGSIDDNECLCTKYRGPEYLGATCEKCGCEVTLASERGRRFGRIELATPVAHPWKADATIDLVPVLPPDARPLAWREIDPEKTERLEKQYERELELSWMDRTWSSRHGLRMQTHTYVLGGTNHRYARVITQNERLRAFREKGAPEILLEEESAELFRAVASLFGGNRWSRDDRKKPASIAARLEHARFRDAPVEEIERELLAACIIVVSA